MKKTQREQHDGASASASASGEELLRAVAQAWLSHSGAAATSATEYNTQRRSFKRRPSRFGLEAMRAGGESRWDFSRTLWDAYEIVDVTKKLERGLVFDGPFSVVAAKPKRKTLKDLIHRAPP